MDFVFNKYRAKSSASNKENSTNEAPQQPKAGARLQRIGSGRRSRQSLRDRNPGKEATGVFAFGLCSEKKGSSKNSPRNYQSGRMASAAKPDLASSTDTKMSVDIKCHEESAFKIPNPVSKSSLKSTDDKKNREFDFDNQSDSDMYPQDLLTLAEQAENVEGKAMVELIASNEKDKSECGPYLFQFPPEAFLLGENCANATDSDCKNDEEEDYLGEYLICQSGRMIFKSKKGTEYEVAHGTQAQFHQEFIALDTPTQSLYDLGTLRHKFVAFSN